MSNTPNQQKVTQLAQKYDVSEGAVVALWQALVRGRGTMAQFNHPELGGNGQWMSGMVMISDMFNDALKAKVSGLCSELIPLAVQEQPVPPPVSWQSQAQYTEEAKRAATPPANAQAQRQNQGEASSMEFKPFAPMQFSPMPTDAWWPAGMGTPNSVGTQNDMGYAYFADARRLALKVGQHITVYDTKDHRIGGVSQQQSTNKTLAFTSQHGTVFLSDLPVVSRQ